jgi:hypothetical protein
MGECCDVFQGNTQDFSCRNYETFIWESLSGRDSKGLPSVFVSEALTLLQSDLFQLWRTKLRSVLEGSDDGKVQSTGFLDFVRRLELCKEHKVAETGCFRHFHMRTEIFSFRNFVFSLEYHCWTRF